MKIVVKVDNGTEWTFRGTAVSDGDVLTVLTGDSGTYRFPIRHVLWWIESEAA